MGKWQHISPDLYIDCPCSLEDLQNIFTQSTKGITQIIWYSISYAETSEAIVEIRINNKHDPSRITDIPQDSYHYYKFHVSFTGDDGKNIEEVFSKQVLYVRALVKQLKESACKVYLISLSEEYYDE